MTQPTIVLVGVGGSGMSGLAGLLLELGYNSIVGIDAVESTATQQLAEQGVTIIIGHGNYTVMPDHVVLYSHATVESIEVETARQHATQDHVKAVHPMLYAQFLGEISKYCTTVAVTGTHGKSSTSSLVAYAMSQHTNKMGLAVVGATLPDRNNKGYYCNPLVSGDLRLITDQILSRKAPRQESLYKKYFFVVEADEYNKHFLNYDVDYGIITTCDIDHFDTYKSVEQFYESFYQFAQRTRYSLYLPEQHDQGIARLLRKFEKTTKSFPIIKQIPTQQFPFTHLLGGHNHGNASLAHMLVNDIVNPIKDPAIEQSIYSTISGFRGISRRAEPIGYNEKNIQIISDYGHHPIEIDSTLKALKEKYHNKKITVVFEPHQLTRVVVFWDAFKEALQRADQSYISPIYAARELFATIQRNYPEHPINSVADLQAFTHLAAQHRNAHPLDSSEILNTINSIDEGIIVLFTAGGLDSIVRTHAKKSIGGL